MVLSQPTPFLFGIYPSNKVYDMKLKRIDASEYVDQTMNATHENMQKEAAPPAGMSVRCAGVHAPSDEVSTTFVSQLYLS